MKRLYTYGWKYAEHLWPETGMPGCIPGRVMADFGTTQLVVIDDEPETIRAVVSGQLQHGLSDGLPKVGDWVSVRPHEAPGSHAAVIESVLPRRNSVARKVAGRQTRKQVMAANVDTAFILQALDEDFSPERISRYLYQLTSGDITAALILNKADKATDVQPYLDAVAPLGLPVTVCSAATGMGVDDIRRSIAPARTVVLLGSSGVGKSTLTNLLVGKQAQATREVRASDSTGQHTTTHRELFVLPGGGLLIDTPGIRELQLWGGEEDLDSTFENITALAAGCRFRNCRHGQEAGCQIQAALQDGRLARRHYANYLKLQSELRTLKHRARESDKTAADAIQKKKARAKLYKQSSRDMRNDLDYPH